MPTMALALAAARGGEPSPTIEAIVRYRALARRSYSPRRPVAIRSRPKQRPSPVVGAPSQLADPARARDHRTGHRASARSPHSASPQPRSITICWQARTRARASGRRARRLPERARDVPRQARRDDRGDGAASRRRSGGEHRHAAERRSRSHVVGHDAAVHAARLSSERPACCTAAATSWSPIRRAFERPARASTPISPSLTCGCNEPIHHRSNCAVSSNATASEPSSTALPPKSRPARSSVSSARTAPARRRRSTWSSGLVEARRRNRAARQRRARDRSDERADVRARPQRHRLSRAGELDLSQTLGRRQHPADLGAERRPARRAGAPSSGAARGVRFARLRRRARRQPFRRRAAARRDRARARDRSRPFCCSTSPSPASIRSPSPTFRR